tara:strand:- start:1181 stop:1444 length:264 start_codon:yes stop_codon:yes gene_type:complete
LTNRGTKTQNTKVDLLDVIIVSEKVECRKPAPEAFQIALTQAKSDTDETWFVGDHQINDVKGARDVDIKTVWMTGSHDLPDSKPPPQ